MIGNAEDEEESGIMPKAFKHVFSIVGQDTTA